MKSLRRVSLVVFSCLILMFTMGSMLVSAEDLGGIYDAQAQQGQVQQGQQPQQEQPQQEQGGQSVDGGLSDYMKSFNPLTDENMANANKYASPIVNIIGNVIGFILILTIAGIAFVTACDLAYIGLPFTRSFLAPNAQQNGSGMGMGMPGMGMQAQQNGGGKKLQLVSDECLACVAAAGGSQGGMSSPGGYGMMGGMGAMGGSQPQQSKKSIIFAYLKKRIIFIVLFAVAAIVLTSSALTNCGINVAQLTLKVIWKLGGSVGGIEVE